MYILLFCLHLLNAGQQTTGQNQTKALATLYVVFIFMNTFSYDIYFSVILSVAKICHFSYIYQFNNNKINSFESTKSKN